MEFKGLEPTGKIEGFCHNGVSKIAYSPAAINADSIHIQYDVPALICKAEVSENIKLINLNAWNDDPIVIQAIKKTRCQSLLKTN